MLVERHFAGYPGPVTLVNEYGPTEATVWASYHRFDRPGPVSIGVPVPGVNLYVLDDRLRPVPYGGEGELVIGGAGVSRGYFGRPAATARVFVEDPFAATAGARMYRTGDLVRWTDHGTLDFIGRRDHQVKIRGYRVELGAVEETLRSLPGISDAVVVPDGTRSRLTGFVIAPAGVDSEDVRRELTDRLPPTMVPARVVAIPRFPLTPNGKIDRTRLSAVADEPATPAPVPGIPDVASPQGDTVRQVAAAWAQVLKVNDVPTDVNFFDVGGHSLAMFRLQGALENHTGVRPSVVSLFQHTTVSAQAALIRAGRAAPNEPSSGLGPSAAQRARALRARRQRARREGAK
jgi:acyl carrier protein